MSSCPHVLVDATAIPPDRAGVGRYLAELLPALDGLGVPMTIAVQSRDAAWIRTACPSANILPVAPRLRRRPLRLIWEQIGLPRLAARSGAELIFSPHYTMPLLGRLPVVATFHDATFLSHPELHEPAKRVFFRAWIRLTGRRAAALIVPSRSTRDELVRRAGIRPELMTVAYHGVDSAVFRVPSERERDAMAQRLGTAHWIAFLGTIEPRKNLGQLVRAFGRIATEPAVTAAAPGLVLAVAGGRGWDGAFDAEVAASPVAGRIRTLGFLPDEALPGLLGGAELVAYPSLGEGFGMPVIEAMACGAPVLTTRALSLPEIGGDVAFYSEPDADSLAGELRRLLLDRPLRARRGKAGRVRAEGFSWQASAETHRSVFARAVGWTT
jgi:glycosyltransferase involved in cell wall biosynthesis